jgi:tetratricopeptide (TPR) repeat protein
MNPRLLKDLDARAAMAKDDNERLLIRAERAGVLARVGQTEGARAEIAELRNRNRSYSPALAAWILLSEGLVEHFESLSQTARDKFARAYAIAVSVGDRRLRGLSASWLGTCDYRNSDYDGALARTLEAIGLGEPGDHLTLSRAWLVLADCTLLAGESETALRCYAVAREHAVSDGDIGMQTVILHNAASGYVNELSIAHAFGIASSIDPGLVELQFGSMANLERGIGFLNLQSATALVRAQLLVSREDWSEAYRLIREHLENGNRQGHGRWRARLLAEAALCSVMLNETESARSYFQQSSSEVRADGDPDDLALTYARLAEVESRLGNASRSSELRDLANRELARFRNEQAQLGEKLVPVLRQLERSLGTSGA